MTDLHPDTFAENAGLHPLSLAACTGERDLMRKRRAQETRAGWYGRIAVTIACFFLIVLVVTIIKTGMGAFIQTQVRLPIQFDREILHLPQGVAPEKLGESIHKANFRALAHASLRELFPSVTGRAGRFQLYGMLSDETGRVLRRMVEKDPKLLGTRQEVWVPMSATIDMVVKGRIKPGTPAAAQLGPKQLDAIKKLQETHRVARRFNGMFLTRADSREPEQAGVLGSFVGSLYIVLVCLLVAMPLGVGAAIYLEEFAPKNRWTDFIEVNINNLAAVPSIIFGLLALAIFLNLFEMPRSSALVGGLALSMLVLPTMVITTRHALKAVPPSIRDAAAGLGASPMQILLHHTLPLALPGIMTGAILSLARALGETAPLLMIGMVAFIADVPHTLMDPASALPVQIYLWADSPERAFMEKTAGAILVLLGVLVILNALAVFLRRKFEYKW
ncbi:MAG: phosphate ABC transporter permease PstA [Hyphomicrobiales bacterium]|nr:phosphate ABC transporter permease PstA [Rickettsiales bacterium]MCP5361042.1 phosphate ABC transporter permease PstA [Hyphomicrobiales bacterium]